jgi:SAM-dependent methyltransferase
MARTRPFDALPERYDRWFDENRGVYASELEALRMVCPRAGRGLEIGVGTGRFAGPLGVRFGLDPSSAMLSFARGRGVIAVAGAAEELPFKGAAFDYALMVTVICFLDDVRASFSEAWRVLKDDGEIVVGFIDSGSAFGREYIACGSGGVFYGEASFYSSGEVAQLLDAAGFRDISFTQTVFHGPGPEGPAEGPRDGRGEGAFVAARAIKKGKGRIEGAVNRLAP